MKTVVVVLAPLAIVAGILAQSSDLDNRIDREMPSLVETYKKLHASPELSGQEEKTSAWLAGELRTLGYTVTDHIGKYADSDLVGFGVAGVLKNGTGPTVLVRTELDALPVTEKTGLPYASQVQAKNADGQTVSVMHACGHDIHMSALLGSARILAATRDRWHGTVILIGQPAEELNKGADAMLKDNLYQRVGRPDFVISVHDSSDLESGVIAYASGYAMANIDAVDITIRGVGGHGAMPDHTKDPVVLAAETVLALQTIVSREVSPLDPTVVTVGSIHGGTKRNVIPDDVKLQLTVRTYKKEVRQRVLAAIQRTARGLAVAAGVPEDRMPIVSISETERGDALYNDPPLTARVVKAWAGAFPKDRIVEIPPQMVSEDVGHFGLDGQIPVLQFRVGAVAPATLATYKASGQPLPALHSAEFAPLPEPAIRSSVRATVLAVYELMSK